MPNPVSWNFRNFDWTFGSNPTTVTVNPIYQNDVRQFTAGDEPTEEFTKIPPIPCKRKSLEVVPPRPTKQFISERKMIEHLSGLHLSSEFTNHNISPVDYDEFEENQPHTVFMSPADLEQKLKNAQKITVCDEVRKITDDPLLPKSLLDRAAVPSPYCSALVLWQPPTSILKVHSGSNNNNEEQDEKAEEKINKKSDEKKKESTSERELQLSFESAMEAEMMFANNNSSTVDFNNLDTMDLDL